MGKRYSTRKDDAERQVRHLCHVWEKEKGARYTSADHPSFSEFYTWMETHYRAVLDFKTTVANPRYFVEMWFDQEFHQTWRN